MQLTYLYHGEVLLRRAAAAVPQIGAHVTLIREGSVGQRFLVVDVDHQEPVPGRVYYSIQDEAAGEVLVHLGICRREQEG